MELPQMKYQGNSYQIQTVQFKGLNRRPEPADGEYSDCQNLTTRAFPHLAPRQARAAAEKPGDPTAIFGWDKLVVVADGKLYLENEEICEVNDAPKQFAVVSSKLIVWPDRLQIDLTNHEVLSMNSEFYQDPSPLFAADSIRMSSLPMVEREYQMTGYRVSSQDDPRPWINYFGYDAGKIFWDAQSGWTSDGQTPLEPDMVSPTNGASAGAIFIPKITVQADGSYLYEIPAEDWNYNKPSEPLSRADENQMGIFGILTRQESYGYGDTVRCSADFYQAGAYGAAQKIELQPGDRVKIEGAAIQANDQESIRVEAITKGTPPDYEDVLQFAGTPFLVPADYVTLTENIPADNELVVTNIESDDGDDDCWLTFPRNALVGEQVLHFTGSFTWKDQTYEVTDHAFYLYDRATESLIEVEWRYRSNLNDDDEYHLRFRAYSREPAAVELVLPIPELDYICEKDNRLWGVSNATDNEVYDPETGQYRHYTSRVLYASALGLPHRFFDFDGTAADSFQVAVASEGDFTGIIGYSDSVVAMKEDKVYRVFGDYPAAYQMYEYTIPGCAEGSHMSLQIIGEILYYAGRNGIYAYDGSAPQLMSYPLGDVTYEDAVAGTDGVRYYLSCREKSAWHLFVYDTLHGVWTREDATQAVGFALVEGTLYMAAGGNLYKLEQDSGENISWSASFAALEEDTLQRKRWKWLRLRIRLEDGAWMKVYYTPDNGQRTLAEQLSGAGTYTVRLPLAPMRCDRLTIDIEAQGRGQVQAMERAFYPGSEVY